MVGLSSVLKKWSRLRFGFTRSETFDFPQPKFHFWPWLGEIILITFTYWLSAQAGLHLTSPISGLSPFWPPSGIALFLILNRGLRLSPAIFLGHLLVSAQTGLHGFTMIGLSLVATLEVSLSAYLLLHVFSVDLRLRRMADIRRFFLTAVILSPLLATLIATAILRATGVEEADSAWIASRTYFFGNALGVLVLTPLLFAIQETQLRPVHRARLLEAVLLIVISTLTCRFIFGQSGAVAFLVIPVLIWAALRFNVLGASALALLINIWGSYATLHDQGPFMAVGDFKADLSLLFTFVGLISVTGLLLSTATRVEAHRRFTEETDRERRRFQLRNASDLQPAT